MKRRKTKLYRQWVNRGALPPEALQEEVTENVKPQKVDRQLSRLGILYVLLGISLVILCVGLAFLTLQSC